MDKFSLESLTPRIVQSDGCGIKEMDEDYFHCSLIASNSHIFFKKQQKVNFEFKTSGKFTLKTNANGPIGRITTAE